MDLSRLKWPLLIIVIAGAGWLMSSGGVNYMIKNFTKAAPGVDPERDKSDEAGLSLLGGYLFYLWQWEKSAWVFNQAIGRYGPKGANYWYNQYRLARCYNHMGQYQKSHDILRRLIAADARRYDKRIANQRTMEMRVNKLKAIHGLR